MVLPSSLRRVMAKKFPDFDKYQLGELSEQVAIQSVKISTHGFDSTLDCIA